MLCSETPSVKRDEWKEAAAPDLADMKEDEMKMIIGLCVRETTGKIGVGRSHMNFPRNGLQKLLRVSALEKNYAKNFPVAMEIGE